MDQAGITVVRLPYDDSCLRAYIQASNGAFAGALEFFGNPEELAEFGRRLITFTNSNGPDDEAEFRAGWGNELRLRISTRAGLEFSADTGEISQDHAFTRFRIRCDGEGLKRLGRLLVAFVENSHDTIFWEPGSS